MYNPVTYGFTDVYDEKHAKEALGSKAAGSEYTSEGGVAPSSAAVLYNPAIPTERPEVSEDVDQSATVENFHIEKT